MRVTEEEEVYPAIRSMGALKAQGKDGLQPLFYQRCWHIVCQAVVEFVQGCWREPERLKEVNATIVALILKIPRPTTIEQYRPISLYNVAYKAIKNV
ncbi:unnamed protein product [Linum trigynum]|uniref:Reverse transcriptase n=1 Tax=Linum trigynum TaxID=586398 RepID=A0AAV2E9H4_9ROSI